MTNCTEEKGVGSWWAVFRDRGLYSGVGPHMHKNGVCYTTMTIISRGGFISLVTRRQKVLSGKDIFSQVGFNFALQQVHYANYTLIDY